MAEQKYIHEIKIPPLDGLNADKSRKPEIIVSLTSFPARMPFVPIVLDAMLSQTVKPDRIILWLSEEQFPNNGLPEWTDTYKRAGVEIYFRPDDLKSHKKYYYAIKENPEAIVILVDDDLYYDNDTIEQLYNSYLKFPNAISALTVNEITFDRHNNILSSLKWALWGLDKYMEKPSMRLYFLSGHGTLLPPNALHPEAFNIPAFKKLCLYDDELWLKIMSVLQGTPVVLAGDGLYRANIKDSQVEASLGRRGGEYDGFFIRDRMRKNTFLAYNDFLGSEDTLEKRIRTMFPTENDRPFADYYIRKGLNKRVVYTAVTARGYPLKAPSYITPGWDYICFTDCPELISDFWQIRPLEETVTQIKALPHKYLTDYDYSLWIDPGYDIISDIDEITNDCEGHSAMMLFGNRIRLSEEAFHRARERKDLEDVIIRQLKRYTNAGYDTGRYAPETNLIFREHNNPDLTRVCENWLEEIKIYGETDDIGLDYYSEADDLSLDYVCWRHNFLYEARHPVGSLVYRNLYFRRGNYAPGRGELISALLYVTADGHGLPPQTPTPVIAEKVTDAENGCFRLAFTGDELKGIESAKRLFFMPSNSAVALTLKVKEIRFKAGEPEEIKIAGGNYNKILPGGKMVFNRLDPLMELILPDMPDKNIEAVILSGDVEFQYDEIFTLRIYETPEKISYFKNLRRLLRVMDVTGSTGPTGPLENVDAPFKIDTKTGYKLLNDVARHKQVNIILRDLTSAYDTAISALEKLNQTHQLIWVHGDNGDFAEKAGDILMPNTLETIYVRKADYSFCESKQSFPTERDTPCDLKKDDFILGCWG